jgi:hypothetical protein
MTLDGETLFEGLKTFLVWVGVVVLVITGSSGLICVRGSRDDQN